MHEIGRVGLSVGSVKERTQGCQCDCSISMTFPQEYWIVLCTTRHYLIVGYGRKVTIVRTGPIAQIRARQCVRGGHKGIRWIGDQYSITGDRRLPLVCSRTDCSQPWRKPAGKTVGGGHNQRSTVEDKLFDLGRPGCEKLGDTGSGRCLAADYEGVELRKVLSHIIQPVGGQNP